MSDLSLQTAHMRNNYKDGTQIWIGRSASHFWFSKFLDIFSPCSVYWGLPLKINDWTLYTLNRNSGIYFGDKNTTSGLQTKKIFKDA